MRTPKRLYCKALAKALRTDLPYSEQWFWSKYESKKDIADRSNVYFGGYIPDIINSNYKYVIEVDDSSHNTSEGIARDIKKNAQYERLGYKVFRVIAFNTNSYDKFILELNEFKTQFNQNLVDKNNQDIRMSMLFSSRMRKRY